MAWIEGNQNRPSDYRNYYNHDSCNLVKDLYREDIKNFNYQF